MNPILERGLKHRRVGWSRCLRARRDESNSRKRFETCVEARASFFVIKVAMNPILERGLKLRREQAGSNRRILSRRIQFSKEV